jgi:hypothetical protein
LQDCGLLRKDDDGEECENCGGTETVPGDFKDDDGEALKATLE